MITQYPHFSPISLDMAEDLYPRLNLLKYGISEVTFANFYLFRNTYNYKLAWLPDKHLVVSGEKEGHKFFILPCHVPEEAIVKELFSTHQYIKGLAEELADCYRVFFEQLGYNIIEDRDNFDYLYLRDDLAELEGRKFHKKRNMVNVFINNYTYEEKPLSNALIPDALAILEEWKKLRNIDGDYIAAKEGLLLHDKLHLCGYIYYVDGNPVAYTLGESIAKGKVFAIHFEKALDTYKGLYQFINKAFASVLPKHYKHINREQDLGDEGLRHAKMSYRPVSFVKKYRVVKE